ncbi:tetratricopeptide repeat protein 29 isoform X3 [Engystomops pustulosus]|uniref:tetratricopeptide repeat protein 29 isoform X3 n=1 Tax=Engystomops pustulosus TaxID=76066 RepID=UPI003AFA711C
MWMSYHSLQKKMSILPAMPRQGHLGLPNLVLPKSPRKIQQNGIHLIRDRDVKDHPRHKNIKELSKEETAIYQNSFKHSICIEMLRQGYHKSFSELFTLIHKWNALRDAGGPGSAIWQQKPLEEQHEKLDQLQHFLTRAEAAQRSGQLEKAAEHYEAFYHLTVGRIWKDETGRTHNSLACENLWRIYTLLSDKMQENKEWQQAIKTLIKALDMAKEACDKKMEGEAAYRLGLAHISSGNPQIAMKSLTTYMEISKEFGDNVGLGKAYEAMAKALESQGKIVESIEYLENFIEVAKTSNLSQSLAETCICLGDIFNARGNYEKACQYFSQAYVTAVNFGEIPLIEEAQVHFGIAKAHRMMLAVSRHTEAADYVSMEYLLAWKKNRSDMFSDPANVASLASIEANSSKSFGNGENAETTLKNSNDNEQMVPEEQFVTP